MLAIIGGSGLTQLACLEVVRREVVRTPYGEPSGTLTHGRIGPQEVVFLARHGHGHTIPPAPRQLPREHLGAGERGRGGGDYLGGFGRRHSRRSRAGSAGRAAPDHRLHVGRPATFFDGGEAPVVHVDLPNPTTGPCASGCCARVRQRGWRCRVRPCMRRRKDRGWRLRQKSTGWNATVQISSA